MTTARSSSRYVWALRSEGNRRTDDPTDLDALVDIEGDGDDLGSREGHVAVATTPFVILPHSENGPIA